MQLPDSTLALGQGIILSTGYTADEIQIGAADTLCSAGNGAFTTTMLSVEANRDRDSSYGATTSQNPTLLSRNTAAAHITDLTADLSFSITRTVSGTSRFTFLDV